MPHAQGPGDKEEEVAFADSCLALAEATFQQVALGLRRQVYPVYPQGNPASKCLLRVIHYQMFFASVCYNCQIRGEKSIQKKSSKMICDKMD